MTIPVGKLVRRTFMAVGTLVTSLAQAQSQGVDDRWHYEFSPYLWAAGLDTSVRIGDLSAERTINASDVLSHLDMGLMGAFEARRGQWGVLFDALYVNLSKDRGNTEIEMTQQMYSLAGLWRAVDGPYTVDLMAGARYNYIRPELKFPAPLGTRASTKTAIDPFVGVRGSVPVAPRWSLWGHLDAGTLDGSDYAWQLLVGAAYAFSDTGDLKFGYRTYKVKFSDRDFEVRNTEDGVFLGATFKF
jgi:opacity protein-like surface antigen